METMLPDWMRLDNNLARWMSAVGLTIVIFAILQIARAQIGRRVMRRAEANHWQVYDTLSHVVLHTHILFLLLVALFAGSLMLDSSQALVRTIRSVAVVGLLIQGALWLNSLISYYIGRRLDQEQEGGKSATATVLGILVRIARGKRVT